MPPSPTTADRAAELEAPGLGGFALIAGLYFAYALIGLHPLADVSAGERLDGSLADKLAVTAMFACALGVLWPRRGAVLAALGRRPGFLLVGAVILASVSWSDHPDLTLRRSALYLMLSASGVAVALSARDPRRLHLALFAALAGAALVNLLATAAAPSLAITDIGVRGVYTQKNVAGAIAMAGFIVGVFWTAGTRSPRGRVYGLLALAVLFGFLLATRSKTSIGLALLAPALGGCVAFVARGGRRAALLVLAGGLVLAVTLAALFAASGFDTARALDFLIGDSSFSGRDELWAFARSRIGEAPWFGHGYGAFWDVGPVDDPIAKLEPGTWLGDTEVGTINQAHNGYYDLALNIGVPAAVVAALTISAAVWRQLARAHAPALDREARAAHGAFAALGVVFLLHNLTEATLFLRGAPLWSLMLLALFAPVT